MFKNATFKPQLKFLMTFDLRAIFEYSKTSIDFHLGIPCKFSM